MRGEKEEAAAALVGGRASSKLTRIQERGEFTQAFFDTAESLVNLDCAVCKSTLLQDRAFQEKSLA